MGEPLLGACRKQQPNLSQMLSSAGPIQSVSYSGRHNVYDVFSVTYGTGSVTWWAVFSADGKLVAFTPGS